MAERAHRGFAAMDRDKQRQISSKGGKAAHERGTAHEFTSDEAREAGQKGGKAAQAAGTAHHLTQEERRMGGRKGGGIVSEDRSHMAEIGRKGGQRGRSGPGGGPSPRE